MSEHDPAVPGAARARASRASARSPSRRAAASRAARRAASAAERRPPPVWSDDNWTLHPPVGGSLPGAVWLASRVHVDSFSDLPEELQADFGRVAARVERAILALGDIARVHLYRWGDGGAHFHVWFLPRPLGMVEASGMALPLWEDVLPNVPDEELAAPRRARRRLMCRFRPEVSAVRQSAAMGDRAGDSAVNRPRREHA